jgi:TonB family protein
MPENFSKYLSSAVSIVLHSLVFLIFYFATQHYNPDTNGFIELGFSDGPAGGGSGGTSETFEEPKEKINSGEKINDEKISPLSKPIVKEKSSTSSTTEVNQQKGSGTGGTGTGTGTGSGSGSGSGTGSGKGGFSLGLPVAKPKEDVYLIAVEEMPEPLGGIESINSKVVRPIQAKQKGVNGTVFVQAFVDELGAVRKVMLTKGIGHGCDEAAMNAVSRSRFKPGKQSGRAVKVQVQIPVSVR